MKQPNKKCLQCGKAFYKPKSLDRIKFCCDKCYRENRKTWKLSKEWKEKISKGHLSEATEFKKGEHIEENHLNWKGGKRYYAVMAKRRKGNKCEICNSIEDIEVHHIDRNIENNNIENLQVLCNKCHIKRHRENKPHLIKKCEWCDKEFTSYHKPQRFCSISCGLKNTHNKR